MKERARTLAACALVAALACALYCQAPRAWFEDDDLDTLTWAGQVPALDSLLRVAKVPIPYEPSRPLGHLFYFALWHTAGLRYAPWALSVLALNLVNLLLVWSLARRLGLGRWPASLGALFWAVNPALLDAWWKPMFVFDVLSTTFSLACLLLYAQRRWLWSFAALWLALRAKEIAIFLPVILLAYEMLLGDRKWWRTLVFFVPAVGFGLAGWLFIRAHGAGAYHAVVGWAAQAKSLLFYAKTGAVALAAAALAACACGLRQGRWRLPLFGLVSALAALAVYLGLPDRLLAVYWYWAAIGLALAVAAAVHRFPKSAGAAAIGVLAWQAAALLPVMQTTLAASAERHAYFNALAAAPPAPLYGYLNPPASLHHWGVAGALVLHGHRGAQVASADQIPLPATDRFCLLDWDGRHLDIVDWQARHFAELARGAPLAHWQQLTPWSLEPDGTRPLPQMKTLRLGRPAAESPLEVELCGEKGEGLRLFVDYTETEPLQLQQAGCATLHPKVPPTRAGMVVLDLVPQGGTPRLASLAFR